MKKFILHQNKTVIIAEGCDNHMGSTPDALQMCLRAKLAGADVIKFQHHLPDEEMLPDSPMSDNFQEPLYDFLMKNALSIEQHKEIYNYCKKIDIHYLCTPFSYKAALDLIENLPLEEFKIGSGELRDLPSLEKIASLGCDMILSTGMSTVEEIQDTVNFLSPKVKNLGLMNCTSEYPTKYEDVNLGVIKRMKELFPKIKIGHSDHTQDLYTCFGAVANGAEIIEKHVILDKKTPGPDQSVSIDFNELHQLVDGIRKIELASGSEKKINKNEEQIRTWAYRSVINTIDLKAGQVLEESHLTTKRPGTGIPAKDLKQLIGKTIKKDYKKNSMLKIEDIV